MTEKQLLDKKKKIQKTKETISELKGQEKMLMDQLQNKWKCTTLSEAKKKIKNLEKQSTELQIKIDKATQKLENDYFSN